MIVVREEPHPNDFNVNGFGRINFIQEEKLSVYGKAGLSYHMLDLKDPETSRAVTKITYEDINILNFDVGFGATVALADQVTAGVEYVYSDTLSKDDSQVSIDGLTLQDPSARINGLALKTNEITATLGFKF